MLPVRIKQTTSNYCWVLILTYTQSTVLFSFTTEIKAVWQNKQKHINVKLLFTVWITQSPLICTNTHTHKHMHRYTYAQTNGKLTWYKVVFHYSLSDMCTHTHTHTHTHTIQLCIFRQADKNNQ